MSRIKTCVMSGIVVAFCAAQAGMAAPSRQLTEQAQVFATCLGRYTAEREFGWLTGQADPQAEARRSQFEDLLRAVIDDARQNGLSGPEILNMRIRAKRAQTRLLNMAKLGADQSRAARARAMAYRELRICETMVLGS